MPLITTGSFAESLQKGGIMTSSCAKLMSFVDSSEAPFNARLMMPIGFDHICSAVMDRESLSGCLSSEKRQREDQMQRCVHRLLSSAGRASRTCCKDVYVVGSLEWGTIQRLARL